MSSTPPQFPISADDFRRLEDEMKDMKSLMGQMTTALTRLALLEERHQSVSAVTNKILEQVEEVRKSQHLNDLRLAGYADMTTRVADLERVIRENHLEYSKDKAANLATVRTLKLSVGAAWIVFAFALGTAAKIFWGA